MEQGEQQILHQALVPALFALQMASGVSFPQPSKKETAARQQVLKQQHAQELQRQPRQQNNLNTKRHSGKRIGQPRPGY